MRKLSFKQFEQGVFIFILLTLLSPIWANEYFLTGDGPSHLYNSRVLLDFFTGSNVDFYKEYYSINQNFEPNWFTHIVLSFLLLVFPGLIAEKIFLSLYVILFAIALRLLLKAIHKDSAFLAILGLPFIFHHTFQMGFYNYVFSIVFLLFNVGYWYKNRDNFGLSKGVIFMLSTTVLYFTHPIGFLFSGLVIAVFSLVDFFTLLRQKKALKKFYRKTLILTASFLPSILFMLTYFYRKGIDATPNPDSTKRLYHGLLELRSLISVTDKEAVIAIALAAVFAMLLIYALYTRIKAKKLRKEDAFFLLFFISILIYFNQPGGMSGGLIISERLQFIPYLMLLLWLSTIQFNSMIKKGIIVLGSVITILFTVVRFPVHALASEAVEEYLSVGEYIPKNSTVLPLSFSHNGKTIEGELISDKIWLFMHAADYLGVEKSLILLGNYEGNTGYFPINWKQERNPFKFIAQNEGIEYQPPNVDFVNYNAKTGGEVDYVITWNLDEQYIYHAYTKSTLDQLSNKYQLIFETENKRAQLYKKREPH